LSFKIASAMATRKGIQDATPVLLEPVMDVEIQVPEAFMGDVNRDLNGRRGRVLGMDSRDGLQLIRAQVPMAELANYATELRSITGGRGTFRASLDHYEQVPGHVAQRVIDEHKKDGDAAH
jgi:elongation factor G